MQASLMERGRMRMGGAALSGKGAQAAHIGASGL